MGPDTWHHDFFAILLDYSCTSDKTQSLRTLEENLQSLFLHFSMPEKKRDKMKGENIGENLEQAATLGNGLTDDKRP